MYRPFQLCTSCSELRAKQLVAERGKTWLHRTYFLLINLAIAALLVGITELTVLGAFKSEVMLESDIGHSLPEDTSVVSGAVTTTLMRV